MADHVTTIEFRARYAETDQMGIVHHANYLVWCEQARTDHMRQLGVSYRAMEESGLRLPVVEASVRYRQPTRYDDLVQVSCWVREVASRKVTFGYAVRRAEDGLLLATAQTSLIPVHSTHGRTSLPPDLRDKLVVSPDPVRL